MKRMKVKPRDMQALWGDSGPCSQVNIKTQVRILDDSISRVFLLVEVEINPYTYSFVKKHLKDFAEDETVCDIINNCRYMGKNMGYVAVPYDEELAHYPETFLDFKLFDEANGIHKIMNRAIIRMHEYVIAHYV